MPSAPGGDVAAAARAQRGDGKVIACSHHGRGSISGSVRGGHAGEEVRLPGGTWLGCWRDGQRTLRGRGKALDHFETPKDRIWDN